MSKRRIQNRGPGFTCIFCERRFPGTVNQFIHIRRHIQEKPYLCGHCDFAAVGPTDLKNHYDMVHSTEKYNCSKCPLVFNCTRKLKEHWRLKHDKNRPSFQCEVCNAQFPYQFVLKNHQRKHTGDRPHKCQVCGKGFSQSSDLNKHIGRLHRGMNISKMEKNLCRVNEMKHLSSSPKIKVDHEPSSSPSLTKEESETDWDLIAEIF